MSALLFLSLAHKHHNTIAVSGVARMELFLGTLRKNLAKNNA